MRNSWNRSKGNVVNAELQIVSHDMAAKMIQAGAVNVTQVVDNGAMAAGAYQSAYARSCALVDAINSYLALHGMNADRRNAERPGSAWRHVGDLNSVNTQLADVLAQLGGRL